MSIDDVKNFILNSLNPQILGKGDILNQMSNHELTIENVCKDEHFILLFSTKYISHL